MKKQHCLTLNTTLFEAARKKSKEKCNNNFSEYVEGLIIADLLQDKLPKEEEKK